MSKGSKIASLALLPAAALSATLLYQAFRYVWFGIPTDVDRVMVTFLAVVFSVPMGCILAYWIEKSLEDH